MDGFYDADGQIPCQIDGGLKCFGHPIGASGLRMLYEMYLQLQGRAGARQLKNPQHRHDAQSGRRARDERLLRRDHRRAGGVVVDLPLVGRSNRSVAKRFRVGVTAPHRSPTRKMLRIFRPPHKGEVNLCRDRARVARDIRTASGRF